MRKLLLIVLMSVVGISVSMAQAVGPRTAAANKTKPMHQSLVTQEVKEAKTKIAPFAPLALNQEKVISSVSHGDKKIQLVQNANGTISKRILLNNKIQKLERKPTTPSNQNTEDYTLFESFEDWDGVDPGWTPDGWSRDNKTTFETWYIADMGSFFDTPSDGDYAAWVDWGFDLDTFTPTDPRDETLISPAFTPVDGNYLIFDALYSTYFMFYDIFTGEFYFDDPIFSIQVLVSTDNGVNWNVIWDASKAENYSEYDENDLDDAKWYTQKVSLSDYAGKSIKIAFRYYDREGGDSVGLDNIAVRQLQPEALYIRPQGYFYINLDTEWRSLLNNYMIGATYTPATWYNLSVEADSYSWELADPENRNATIISTEVNPTVTYYGLYSSYVPTLTAKANGGRDSTYFWGKNDANNLFFAGGTNSFNVGEPEPVCFGAGNFDYREGLDLPRFAAGQYCFGTNSLLDIKSVANYFEKPAHKYLITQLWALVDAEAPAGTEFTLTIHRVSNAGVLTDVIATSTCTIEDYVEDDMVLPFKAFAIIDPETGLEILVDYVEIEDAILVELSGFYNVPGVTFGAVSQTMATAPGGESNAYVSTNYFSSESDDWRWLNSANYLVDGATSLAFSMEIIYSYLVSDSDVFTAPDAGGEKTFQVDSYYAPDYWWIEEDLPEWLSDDLTFDSNTWEIQYTLKAEPLPENVKNRRAVVKITTYGADMSILVLQGKGAGLSPMAVATKTKVANKGDRFELIYTPDYSSVSVYNIAGQKLAGYALPATGTFTVPNGNYSQGIYLFRFAGATGASTVKVIK